MEHPSGSIELEPLEETRFELGSCLDLNAKPVRTDEFGRQLGNRAAGPRHGVHSQLLPPKNSLTWRSEVQSSGEGDASKASGLRSPVALVAKRNLTMQSAMLSGAVWLMRSRSSPKPAPRQRDRRPRLRIALPPPSGYAFRAPFQGRSIHWVTWAGTPLFWALFFGCPHP